jgi:hypothetical protein
MPQCCLDPSTTPRKKQRGSGRDDTLPLRSASVPPRPATSDQPGATTKQMSSSTSTSSRILPACFILASPIISSAESPSTNKRAFPDSRKSQCCSPCLFRAIRRRAQRDQPRKTNQAMATREKADHYSRDEPTVSGSERRFSQIAQAQRMLSSRPEHAPCVVEGSWRDRNFFAH